MSDLTFVSYQLMHCFIRLVLHILLSCLGMVEGICIYSWVYLSDGIPNTLDINENDIPNKIHGNMASVSFIIN
jgi:hypothetical protein